ncbi:acyl-CoA synthetase [Limibacter armeniacum]|uniref:acyl-CoA synthetase n=1 Tax=Limibacter armeniacum TaxID=466084 RepID=UPI002FE5B3BB
MENQSVTNYADILELEKLPLFNSSTPHSTYGMIKQAADRSPDRAALHFFLQAINYQDPISYSYGALMENIHQTANMFYGLGIGAKDVISVILPNTPETIFSILGGETAGIVNPINPLLEPEQMADIMNAAGTKLLVTLGPFPKTDIWQKVNKIRHKVPTLETILTVDLSDYLPTVKRWLVKWMAPAVANSKDDEQRILPFSQTCHNFPKDKIFFKRTIKRDDIASYFHTGGTTGHPKLAAHTHGNEIADTLQAKLVLPQEDKHKVFFCGLPWFHVNGVTVTGLVPFSNGDTLILGSPSGYRGEGIIQHFWKMVEHYHINFFSGVPTVYAELLKVPIGNSKISSLEFGICGAAPMPVKLFQDFEKTTGVKIIEGYGLTEGTCISAVNPPYGERKIGSIGIPLPYQPLIIGILNEEGQFEREANTDEIGIILIKGPNVFPGYKEEAHNHQIWVTDKKGEKWLNTGDIGRQDHDKYIWLTGRKKELIIRGGHNIDPKMIEEPIQQHPAVMLSAAVGRPDNRAGEVPVLYVQLKEGQQTTSEELMVFAKENITERAAIPKAIHIIDKLPVTAIGKIFKPALVFKEVEAVYRSALPSDEFGFVSIKAKQDKKKGLTVQLAFDGTVNVESLKEKVDAKLGVFPIPFEIMHPNSN